MNRYILRGKWLEIKGSIQEKWGKLTDNDSGEIEGKNTKLLGLLQKKYGYIRDKGELAYEDSTELAAIVGAIRKMTKKDDVRAIVFIARYGQPLLAIKQENQITGKEDKNGYDTDRYFDSRLNRRNTRLAVQ
jgi:uncharacterized protein YjbJ (UPF0337 family)